MECGVRIDMYKIEILNDCNNNKFNQLTELIRKFAIDVFIVQKFNLSNESYNKKEKYINNYKNYLSSEELIYLNKDINERIEFAINSINSTNADKKTRYYILLNEEKVIAFQTAQVRKENNRIEGWRNFAYTENTYKGKVCNVVDTFGYTKKGITSNLIYENITKWFIEEKVEIEKTATGKNMYKNIKLYIIKKGFIPEKYDDKRIYLIKDYAKNNSKIELKHIYEEYIKKLKVKL